jgi:hypothetical protein
MRPTDETPVNFRSQPDGSYAFEAPATGDTYLVRRSDHPDDGWDLSELTDVWAGTERWVASGFETRRDAADAALREAAQTAAAPAATSTPQTTQDGEVIRLGTDVLVVYPSGDCDTGLVTGFDPSGTGVWVQVPGRKPVLHHPDSVSILEPEQADPYGGPDTDTELADDGTGWTHDPVETPTAILARPFQVRATHRGSCWLEHPGVDHVRYVTVADPFLCHDGDRGDRLHDPMCGLTDQECRERQTALTTPHPADVHNRELLHEVWQLADGRWSCADPLCSGFDIVVAQAIDDATGPTRLGDVADRIGQHLDALAAASVPDPYDDPDSGARPSQPVPGDHSAWLADEPTRADADLERRVDIGPGLVFVEPSDGSAPVGICGDCGYTFRDDGATDTTAHDDLCGSEDGEPYTPADVADRDRAARAAATLRQVPLETLEAILADARYVHQAEARAELDRRLATLARDPAVSKETPPRPQDAWTGGTLARRIRQAQDRLAERPDGFLHQDGDGCGPTADHLVAIGTVLPGPMA